MQENPFDKGKKNFCTFYIVRHGETKWNVEKKIQGHGDSPLTQKGLQQVKTIVTELKQIKFHAIYSSDLLRAKRTAEIIALEHKLAVKTTQFLRERRYAELEGKPRSILDDFNKVYDTLSNEERLKFKISENIESDEDMISRFITFLRETAILYPGKNILVTTHGGMMRILLIHLGFGTYKNIFVGIIDNAAYIKLLSDGVDFFIEETKGINKDENK